MWSTAQRVPSSQLLSPSDSSGRMQDPDTLMLADSSHSDSPHGGSGVVPTILSDLQQGIAQQRSFSQSSMGAEGNAHGYGQQQQHQPQQQQGAPNRADRGGSNSGGNSSERSGGQPGQNGSGNGNGSGNSSSDGEEESEIEELPQVTVDMIPLSVIIGRMVTFAYTELVTLVETLPSRSESNRREEILKYTSHMREQLTKLLVLVRWAQNAPQIQKCQNVIAYLQSQNEYFTRSVDGLYATYLSLPQARVRNYDVSNAIDILTSGSYQRLPSVIKETFAPPQKLTKKQIRQTLSAINDIIRGRILRGEPIPLAMRRYKISGGRITFTVASEFEVTLTLLQYTPSIPWHVVGVRVLVVCDKALPAEQQIRLDARQMADLAQQCQAQLLVPDEQMDDMQSINDKQLDRAKESTSTVQGDSSDNAAARNAQPPQLARLYDYLHLQSLTIFLETIVKQAGVLKRTRWENLLQIEMSSDRSMLTLRYWTSSRAAASAHVSGYANVSGVVDSSSASAGVNAAGKESVHQAAGALRGNSIVLRLCPLSVPRPIHASAVEGPDALEASPRDNANAGRGEFLRIERDRRNLIPKIGLSVTWTAQSGLSSAKLWTRTVSQASEMSTKPADTAVGDGIVLDAESVNTGKLLRQVTWQHSRDILQSLYTSVATSGLFDEDAVELLYVAASGAVKKADELTKEEVELATVVPKLRAWYRRDEGAVDITVDAFTGRLVVRASEVVSVSASLSEAMVNQLADQLNRTPWRLAALLVDMRSSLALADLDSLSHRSLGLRCLHSLCTVSHSLPGFVLTSIRRRAENSSGAYGHHSSTGSAAAGGANPKPGIAAGPGGSQGTPHMGGNLSHIGISSPAMTPSAVGGVPGIQQQQQQHQGSSATAVSANFPLRISQQEADALTRDVAGVDQPLSRIRFYKIEGIEYVEEQDEPAKGVRAQSKGEWHLMVAMTDRLRFRLVLVNPHPTDPLMYVVGQVISLQVDRLFSSVARRLLAEKSLEPAMFSRQSSEGNLAGNKRNIETTGSDATASSTAKSNMACDERDVTERVDAMLTGRTSITLDYLNALASACRARLALRLLQTQLTRWRIPYSFRIPSFSTSPHGHRAAISQELSVVGIDKMGLYELDEQVPILYIPIAGLMRASPINWNVVNQGVLPDEARRMVSIRIASDELDPSMRTDLSPSTRVDQHRQAAIAKATKGKGSSADHSRVLHRPLPNNTKHPLCAKHSAGARANCGSGRPFIGRDVIPCQVIASIPVALDGLPDPVSRAHADMVYFGARAESDGGYHRNSKNSSTAADDKESGKSRGGYSKMVFVYKQVSRALQCLIRDWSEHHMMTHIARQLYVWEQRSLRRLVASTTAYYPFSAGPYTAAVANMLGSWRGHQSTELVIQCISSCFLSISCRVPYPFANEDRDKSLYPPDYEDSGGNDLSYHLTLAEVDPRTNKIVRIASTWPWVFSHIERTTRAAVQRNLGCKDTAACEKLSAKYMGFELSTSLSRWLRTLQAKLNLTGSPVSVLALFLQLMPVNDALSAIASQPSMASLSPSLQLDSQDSLIRLRFEGLLEGDVLDTPTAGNDGSSGKLASGQDSSLEGAGDEDKTATSGLDSEDRSYVVLQRVAHMHKYFRKAFAPMPELDIMYMYTAADNIRLVVSSRYVLDLRLVANDLFHVSDAVAATRAFARQPTLYGSAPMSPPPPLVTATTEPIPMFAEWLNALSSSIKFNWALLERGVSKLLISFSKPSSRLNGATSAVQQQEAADAASSVTDSSSPTLDPREKVRMFQRNMYRLRPDATAAEEMIFRLRELANRQNSTRSPTFVPLPPYAILCAKIHMLAIVRSLMQWIFQSAHVLDSLVAAIAKTQQVFEQAANAGGSNVSKHAAALFGVEEVLVDKRQMIVAFTGSRGTVRCEFVMKTGVKQQEKEDEDEDENEERGPVSAADAGDPADASMDVDGGEKQPQPGANSEEDLLTSLCSDLFSIPKNLLGVFWDVRVLPIVHPPKGVSERVATFLAESFNKQKTSIGQKAGVLVRLIALPPHLLEDAVKISMDMKGKVEVCAINDGYEYDIRLDAAQALATFWLRFCGADQKTWAKVVVEYALLTGTARVKGVLDGSDGMRQEGIKVKKADGSQEAAKPMDAWSQCLDGVIRKLDDMTAFTTANGKDGKSRWFDIVSNLYAAQLDQLDFSS